MKGYIGFCLLSLYYFTFGYGSPQSSIFGWPAVSEAVNAETITIAHTTARNAKSLEISVMEPTTSPRVVETKATTVQTISVLAGTNLNQSISNTTDHDKHNTTSGLSNLLGSEISSFIASSVVFLGAALRREGCDLKAACLAGTLVPQMQGRDLAMIAVEPLVPEGWQLLYQAAKASMIQGQDCSQFNCT